MNSRRRVLFLDDKHEKVQTAQHNPRNSTEPDLDEIIRLSGLHEIAIPQNKSSVWRTVKQQENLYKVRSYRSMQCSSRQLALMNIVPHLFPRCVGRVDRFLVLEFINQYHQTPSSDIHPQIGKFLAELEQVECCAISDEEFFTWCDHLHGAKLFRSKMLDLVRRFWTEQSGAATRWTLMYRDPRPHNFVVRQQGGVVSIDEKHLREAPLGANTLRARWFFPQAQFGNLLDGYSQTAKSITEPDPNSHTFADFFCCVQELAHRAKYLPRLELLTDRDVFNLRRRLIGIVQAPQTLRIQEALGWECRYRWHRISALPVRIRRHRRRRASSQQAAKRNNIATRVDVGRDQT